MSFASLSVRMALSAFAGPVPEPVLPIFSFSLPAESASVWDLSIMPQLESTNVLFATPNSSISLCKTSGLITTPGPIMSFAFLFKNPLGNILTLYFLFPSSIVWPAFGPAPPLTTIVGSSFCAKYEIILPFPSSPKNPPTTTIEGMSCSHFRLNLS